MKAGKAGLDEKARNGWKGMVGYWVMAGRAGADENGRTDGKGRDR